LTGFSFFVQRFDHKALQDLKSTQVYLMTADSLTLLMTIEPRVVDVLTNPLLFGLLEV
jgi:hypothetical protein